jgi:hypothetical protein
MNILGTHIHTASLVAFIALVAAQSARSMPDVPPDSMFEARRQHMLEVVAGESEVNFYTAAARLRLGKDRAGAYAMFDSLTRDHNIGGMFYAYGMMGAYLHSRNNLPDSLHRKIRAAFRDRTMYRGDTENHWVTYYTGIYLAAQTWPGEPGSTWFNGRSSEENMRESAEWLNKWMETTTTIGQGEFDSPTYMSVFLSPMMVLYEFATDPIMKRKAGMMLDLLLTDFAAEHLKGNFGGAHSRDYPDDIVNPLGAPSTMWAWLFFGEPKFEPWNEARYRPRHRGSWEATFGALGSYKLPHIIYCIATDRAQPYVHRERKRVRNIIRFGDVQNPPVYKYTYMAPTFVMGSIQGGILQPIQQHTWDVTFVSDRPYNTVFMLHPYYAGRELAMFFPEEQKFLAGEVDRYHLVYTNPDKWNSSSPYEQVFQHKNNLIALYHIPPDAKQQHVDVFFPKTLDDRIVDTTGWIFCRSGATCIGLYPLATYQWRVDSLNFRLRGRAPDNGCVVEVAGKEAGSYEAFKSSLRRRRPKVVTTPQGLSVTFVTADGSTMAFSYDGPRKLNGTTIGFDHYPFYAGPFVNAEVGTGVITLTACGQRRVLDFPKAEIR